MPKGAAGGSLPPRDSSPISVGAASNVRSGEDTAKSIPPALQAVSDKAIDFLQKYLVKSFSSVPHGARAKEKQVAELVEKIGKLDASIEVALKLFETQSAGYPDDVRARGLAMVKDSLDALKKFAMAVLDLYQSTPKVYNFRGASYRKLNEVEEKKSLTGLLASSSECKKHIEEFQEKVQVVRTTAAMAPSFADQSHLNKVDEHIGCVRVDLLRCLVDISATASWAAYIHELKKLNGFGDEALPPGETSSVMESYKSSVQRSNLHIGEIKSVVAELVKAIDSLVIQKSDYAKELVLDKHNINTQLVVLFKQKFSLASKMLDLLVKSHAPELSGPLGQLLRIDDQLSSDLVVVHDLTPATSLDGPVQLEVLRHAHRVTLDLRDDVELLRRRAEAVFDGNAEKQHAVGVMSDMQNFMKFLLLTQEEKIAGQETLYQHAVDADVQRKARAHIEAGLPSLTRGAFEPIWTDDERNSAVGKMKAPIPQRKAHVPKGSSAGAKKKAAAQWLADANGFGMAFTRQLKTDTEAVVAEALAGPENARIGARKPLSQLPSEAWFSKQFQQAEKDLRSRLRELEGLKGRVQSLLDDADREKGTNPERTSALGWLVRAGRLIDKDVESVSDALTSLQKERSLLVLARATRVFLEDAPKRVEVVSRLIDSGVIQCEQASADRYDVQVSHDFGEEFQLKVQVRPEMSVAMGYSPPGDATAPRVFDYLHHFHFIVAEGGKPTGSSIKPASQRFDFGPDTDRSRVHFPDVMDTLYVKLKQAANSTQAGQADRLAA